jgi:hypothetical protein
MSRVIHDSPTDHSPDAPADGDQLARQQAIRQIERRRRFRISAIWSAIAMVILVVIWAVGVPQRGRLAGPRVQPEFGDP